MTLRQKNTHTEINTHAHRNTHSLTYSLRHSLTHSLSCPHSLTYYEAKEWQVQYILYSPQKQTDILPSSRCTVLRIRTSKANINIHVDIHTKPNINYDFAHFLQARAENTHIFTPTKIPREEEETTGISI